MAVSVHGEAVWAQMEPGEEIDTASVVIGLLRWEGLDVWWSGQGRSVVLNGVGHAVTGSKPARVVKIQIGASGSVTPSWLRFWSHTKDELIRVLEVAQTGALEMARADPTPAPTLPKARRIISPWLTWAGLTGIMLAIQAVRAR